MHKGCALACGTCDLLSQKERKAETVAAAATATISQEDKEILAESAKFGDMQKAEGAQAKETVRVVQQSIEYRSTDEFVQLPDDIRTNCLNRNELCAFWALIGMVSSYYTSRRPNNVYRFFLLCR